MFAVKDPSASGHALDLARFNDGAVAHAVAMLQRPGKHISDDFHVAMRVHVKAGAASDAILIDDSQAAKPHLLRVVVIRKRKSVETVEPAVLGVPAFVRPSNLNHTRATSALPT